METAGTLAAILADVSSIVTSALSWATSVVTFIVSNPLIMLFIVVSLVGLGIGMVKRMISL